MTRDDICTIIYIYQKGGAAKHDGDTGDTMEINWSEKNIAELELFFSTDAKKGLTKQQYRDAKSRYGENIIDSELLTRQNFYGLKRKRRNIRAMLSGSVGIFGVLYTLTLVVLACMGFEVNLLLFLPFYAFLSACSFAQSGSSEKKYEYLYKVARPKALVIRDDKRKNVFIENIVPGDLILFSAGDIVPADARIVSCAYLSCVHTAADGKISSEGKTAEILKYNPTEIPANIVYAADVVDSGSASAVVVATGENTRIAKLAENTGPEDPASPLIGKSERAKEKEDDYSFMQKRAHQLSRTFFLLSLVFSALALCAGIMQDKNILTVTMTCLAAAAGCFPEQIPIIADYAATHGMQRLSKFGILIKRPAIIDDVNDIDTIIAKKTESFTQDRMRLDTVSGHKPSGANLHEIGHIISYMAMCSNVEEHRGEKGGKPAYSGSAVDVAVFEALNGCGLDYGAVSQIYQKIGKTRYNPKNAVKSAAIAKDGAANLICFGEAFNILNRCLMVKGQRLDRRGFDFHKSQIEALYREYDLVMAVAKKDFSYRQAGPGAEEESNLDFLGFAGFTEPKTHAVFESIDYLKKSGVNPVMVAGGDIAHIKNAALKFGIIENVQSAHLIDDGAIATMGDDMFYIHADKFALFAPIALENRIKLLKALQFKKKLPAVTVNHIEELPLTNERCVAFTSVTTETGILKNKASVIAKNLTVSTILKTLKNAVLVYRNIAQIATYVAMLFSSQYLLVLFSVVTGWEYILNPFGMLWAGIGAGYLFAVSISFNENNAGWHMARRKIKEYKSPKKYDRGVLKYGFAQGLCGFGSALSAFFVCLAMTGGADGAGMRPAQTAAFVAYIVLLAAVALRCIKGRRPFDLGIFKNRLYGIVLASNVAVVLCAVFVAPVREFLGFGEITPAIFGISAGIGALFSIVTLFFKKNILK